jgi:hypothetical protein
VSSSPLNNSSHNKGHSKTDTTHLIQKKGYFSLKNVIKIGAVGCVVSAVILIARYVLRGATPLPPVRPNPESLVTSIHNSSQYPLPFLPQNKSQMGISPPHIKNDTLSIETDWVDFGDGQPRERIIQHVYLNSHEQADFKMREIPSKEKNLRLHKHILFLPQVYYDNEQELEALKKRLTDPNFIQQCRQDAKISYLKITVPKSYLDAEHKGIRQIFYKTVGFFATDSSPEMNKGPLPPPPLTNFTAFDWVKWRDFYTAALEAQMGDELRPKPEENTQTSTILA